MLRLLPPTIRRWQQGSTIVMVVALALAVAGCSPATTAAGAGAVVGVTAAQERGIGGALQDTKIRTHINALLVKEDPELFWDVHLQVQNGRVLLSGTVPDPQSRVEAVRLAWRADGVKEVINELEVLDNGSLTDYARDRWIAARLRTRLLADREVNSLNISIETVNKSVYLIGIAKTREELERVIAHAKDIPYVRRVVSYITVKGEEEEPPT